MRTEKVLGSLKLGRLLGVGNQDVSYQPLRQCRLYVGERAVSFLMPQNPYSDTLGGQYKYQKIARLFLGRQVARQVKADEIRVDDARRAGRQIAMCPLDLKPFKYEHRTVAEKAKCRPLIPSVYKYDRAVGIEIECFGPELKQAWLPTWVRTAQDGSICAADGTEAVELRILVPRSLLEVRLFKVCEILKWHRVNSSCGLHVHLDARAWGAEEAKRRGKRILKWLTMLQELVPTSRRNNSYAELNWSETKRYKAVNFTSYTKHQTIEVRLHSGTVDFNKIIAWVRLLEVLMVCPPPSKAGSTMDALNKLPLTDFDRAYWMNRHRQLNPGQYTGALTATTETE